MTAIVNITTDPLHDSTNTLTHSDNMTKSIMESLPSLKTLTLLIKRQSSTNLDDLLAKKIKTQSTNCSDSESLQQSFSSFRKSGSRAYPTLSRSGSFESVEKDEGFAIEEEFDTEGLTLVDQASKGLIMIPALEDVLIIPQNCNDDFEAENSLIPRLMDITAPNLTPLQHSLEILKNQILIAQFKDFFLQKIANEQVEPVRIPPFVTLEAKSQMVIEPVKEKVNKRLPKKIEEEMEITYGEVEFPFLSGEIKLNGIDMNGFKSSGALLQLNSNVSSTKEDASVPKKRKYNKLNPIFKIDRDDKKENKASKKEKKVFFKIDKPVKKIVKEEITEKKPEIKKPILVKSVKNALVTVPQKTVKKVLKEVKSPMEIEEPIKNTKKKYLSFQFGKRMGEERKKNRWQVSQDIKLGDLQIPVLNFSNIYSVMFDGNKKKSTLIAVGHEYQVNVVSSLENSKRSNPRQPKLKWDPSEHKETELQRFFRDAGNIVDTEVNEEKMIKYLLQSDNDIKRAKKYIKDNKGKISQDLIIKALD